MVFYWNRSRIMRTKCECQRISSIKTLAAFPCSSASLSVFCFSGRSLGRPVFFAHFLSVFSRSFDTNNNQSGP